MILHDGISNGNDGLCQHKIYDRAAAFLQNLPLRLFNKISKENLDHIGGSPRKMVYHYSKRFPNMCMSSSFYDDVMNIAEIHLKYYQTRWFDFGQLYVQPSNKNTGHSWSKRPAIQPLLTPFTQTINYNSNNININNNNNSSQKDYSNNQSVNVNFPNKLVTLLVPTPSPEEPTYSSNSPLHFEDTVTSIKTLPTNNNDYSKLIEENNNKLHIIDNDDEIKSSSISSDGSKSDFADEKTISYAEVIKHPKPPKAKKSTRVHTTEEYKRDDPIKSNRIPPSKKVSIKLPDAPYLPNNQHCAFCKNNGEEESVYRTHFVKDELGNVKCPFLSRYTCPHCKATGAKAHTISRCPLSNKNRSNKFNKQ
ncbi:myb-like protein A [Adelges cooleyi]|uniref:myb-like protein A n=1 Tax=Adelges cooleyi TaxID=133065 RepID=UPI00217F814E|nr:myb-like protein A [Adelges cooleyi]